jgi:uncharacterized protein (DUF952 family)
MRIFHIVQSGVWANHSSEFYEAESLSIEGFIHCSFVEQIDSVIDRYYKNVGEITLLEIDIAKLNSKLVVEPSTGGENYPHIYGPINKSAIVGTEQRKRS